MLDPRTLDTLWCGRSGRWLRLTPEWRFEDAQDDRAAALAELFCRIFEQTADRMNPVPEKLYTEFLNLIGFRPPRAASATGTLQFTVHETVEGAGGVPAGTQVFTPDGQGDNIVYDTERAIEATPARLLDIYYADGVAADWAGKTDLTRPQRFSSPPLWR